MDIWMSGIMYQNGFAESTQGHFVLGNVENDIFASSQFLECILLSLKPPHLVRPLSDYFIFWKCINKTAITFV